jgi:hypothetical protein
MLADCHHAGIIVALTCALTLIEGCPLNRRYGLIAVLVALGGAALGVVGLLRRKSAPNPVPAVQPDTPDSGALPAESLRPSPTKTFENIPVLMEETQASQARPAPTIWTPLASLLGLGCFISAQALLLDAPRAVFIPIALYVVGFFLLQPLLRFYEASIDHDVFAGIRRITQGNASLFFLPMSSRRRPLIFWVGLVTFAIFSVIFARFSGVSLLLLFSWGMLAALALALVTNGEHLLVGHWRVFWSRYQTDLVLVLVLTLLCGWVQGQLPAPALPSDEQLLQVYRARYVSILPTETSGPLFRWLEMILIWLSADDLEAFQRLISLVAVCIIPAVYLLAYQWNGRWSAVIAAGFTAVSGWTLALAKVAPVYAALALMSALYLTAFQHALKFPSRAAFAWVGLLLGLGWLVSPLFIFMALLPLLILFNRAGIPALRQRLAAVLMIFFVMGAVTLPVVIALYPQIMAYEPVSVYGFGLSSAEVFLDALAHSLLMFNITSDPNVLHGLVYRPALSPIPAALFLIGLLANAHQLYRTRRWQDALPLIALVIGLLPSALLLTPPIRYPDLQRNALALPVAFYFVASGAVVIMNGWLLRWRKETVLMAAALLILVLVLVASDARWHYTQAFLPAYEEAVGVYNER